MASQDRLTVDPEGGRRVVGGFEYSFRVFGGNTIDHERGWVYVVESADPYRVQARSLEDGRLVRTFGSGEGDGPGELRQIWAIAAAPDGVVVSEPPRLHRWHADGSLSWTWNPTATSRTIGGSVCMLTGEPVLPVLGGVIYRSATGSMVTIPESLPVVGSPNGRDELIALLTPLVESEIACDDNTAYLLSENRITAYRIGVVPFDVPIPDAFADDAVQERSGQQGPNIAPGRHGGGSLYGGLSMDTDGRLFLTKLLRRRSEFAGVLFSPETGCHSLIVDDAPDRFYRQLEGIYRDSALVVEWARMEREVGGRRQEVIGVGDASGIWLMPLVADPESAARRAEAGCVEAS